MGIFEKNKITLNRTIIITLLYNNASKDARTKSYEAVY